MNNAIDDFFDKKEQDEEHNPFGFDGKVSPGKKRRKSSKKRKSARLPTKKKTTKSYDAYAKHTTKKDNKLIKQAGKLRAMAALYQQYLKDDDNA